MGGGKEMIVLATKNISPQEENAILDAVQNILAERKIQHCLRQGSPKHCLGFLYNNVTDDEEYLKVSEGKPAVVEHYT